MATHPYLDHDGPIAFAHRGGHDTAPENTMASFEHAVNLGYRYLETDVHLSRDGVLMAFHDADLARTCGVDAAIAELTADELSQVRVRAQDDVSHRIPTMAELLEAFPDARFNIDAKSDASVEPLADLVRRHDAIDRVCLASFKRARLRRLRTLLGDGLLTNMSSAEVAALRTARRLPGRSARAAQVPTTARFIDVVTENFVAAAHARGIHVHVWTINDRAEMERLLDLGVDGIMTDECDLLARVMAERGHWSSA